MHVMESFLLLADRMYGPALWGHVTFDQGSSFHTHPPMIWQHAQFYAHQTSTHRWTLFKKKKKSGKKTPLNFKDAEARARIIRWG